MQIYIMEYTKLSRSIMPILDEIVSPNKVVSATRLGATDGRMLLGRDSSARTTLNFSASIYNSLPINIRDLTIFKTFKIYLKSYLLYSI